MSEIEGLMRVAEVAKLLNLAESTVYAFINKGILPAVKIGKAVRVSPHDLKAAVEKMKKRAIGLAA